MWKKNDDGVILDANDNPIFIPMEVFKRVCLSTRCFICGVAPDEKEFNNEHVIPKWILKQFGLFDHSLTLPNYEQVKYSTYKLRCCKKCNSHLSTHYETPVSNLLKEHHQGRKLSYEDKFLIYRWMALLSLKTHLRDRLNPKQLSQLNNKGNIADDYEWSLFHHIHALVRSNLNQVSCDESVFGSFFFAPFEDASAQDSFDYADVLHGRCVMLRFRNICYFAALDDGGYCGILLSHIFERINGPINGLQARELLTELAFVRAHLSDEPNYSTLTHLEEEWSRIEGQQPNEGIYLQELDFSVRKKIMEFCMSGIIDKYSKITVNGELANNPHYVTYLFDDNGEFRNNSIKIREL